MVPLDLPAQEEREDVKDPQVLLALEALTDWLVLLAHLELLAKQALRVSLAALAQKVTWVVLDQKVAKDYKAPEERQENPACPGRQDHLVQLEKTALQEIKVARVRLVSLEPLAFQALEVRPDLLEVLVLPVLKVILESLVAQVLKESKV